MLRVGIRFEGEEGRMCWSEGRSLEGMKEGCEGRKIVRAEERL